MSVDKVKDWARLVKSRERAYFHFKPEETWHRSNFAIEAYWPCLAYSAYLRGLILNSRHMNYMDLDWEIKDAVKAWHSVMRSDG